MKKSEFSEIESLVEGFRSGSMAEYSKFRMLNTKNSPII
jgi:hypothetical protein